MKKISNTLKESGDSILTNPFENPGGEFDRLAKDPFNIPTRNLIEDTPAEGGALGSLVNENKDSGGVTPEIIPGYGDDEDEDGYADGEIPPDIMLGRLASGRKTRTEGRGIGANIRTSGSGVLSKPRTRRKTLLG